MLTILHIDINSYFATVEQQANPRLRGKPIGITGGDRLERTVLGAASIEAKRIGVKTGMPVWEAVKICPQLVLVQGDSDKYLSVTTRFLNILKDYSPNLEVFSIDESFLQLTNKSMHQCISIAEEIKSRIRFELGEWVSCSVGISYNKLMAKLASDLYKPDGLVAITDQQSAQWLLDRVELDEVCGIGGRIKSRLVNLGITNFQRLRQVPRESLKAQFKSYGEVLYQMARGADQTPVVPFYEQGEVKSIGHRHTLKFNTNQPEAIRQTLLKLTELVARRLRAKRLVGKTVNCWYRSADFLGEGMQTTISYTDDGLKIFEVAWRSFLRIWRREQIRMVGASISNLKSDLPRNLTLLPDEIRRAIINRILDEVNEKYGEFTLKRAVLLGSPRIKRMPNPYLADRRFKI